jgi:hypothetical protein
VVRYLSQEWLDEARAMAADQPERPGASCRLNCVVSGSPSGEISAYWVVQNGRVLDAHLGALEDAEVTVTVTWPDAVGIAEGELDVNAAFMQGKVKATGNMAKLMALLPLTATPECRDLQQRVRAVTEF